MTRKVTIPARDGIGRLIAYAQEWTHFLAQYCWEFPETIDGELCTVYGTGFSGWGIWSQHNAALFLARSVTWDDSYFEKAPEGYRNAEERAERALALIRYSLGCHATGEFDAGGNLRWSGEERGPGEAEGYNNWIAPFWMLFLAQAVLALRDRMPGSLLSRFRSAVCHDADIQVSLDRTNFRGEAGESGENRSNPESNAWKAALLTLARGLTSDAAQSSRYLELERALWVSSFATPDDCHAASRSGRGRRDASVFGSHLTPTYTVIHHRFFHPGYMVYSLLPRVQAARLASRLSIAPASEMMRHVRRVLGRLTQLLLPGRLTYPGGKDWPRWAYGQMYLLPVLAHYQLDGLIEVEEALASLVETRICDVEAAGHGSMLLHRLGNDFDHDGWYSLCHESIAASSLAETIEICGNRSEQADRSEGTPRGRDPAQVSPGYSEELASIVVVRRATGVFALCTRAFEGPVQITFLPERQPHLLEWQGNGSADVEIRYHPPAARAPRVLASELHLNGDPQSEECGFTGFVEVGHGESRNSRPFLRLQIAAALLPGRDIMLVYQRVIATTICSVRRVSLHRWRFAQEVHNGNSRQIVTAHQSSKIDAGTSFGQHMEGNWLCVDDALTLSLPDTPAYGRPATDWHAVQPRERQRPRQGIRWLELSLPFEFESSERVRPGQTVAEAPLVISMGRSPVDFAFHPERNSVRFTLPWEEYRLDVPSRISAP